MDIQDYNQTKGARPTRRGNPPKAYNREQIREEQPITLAFALSPPLHAPNHPPTAERRGIEWKRRKQGRGPTRQSRVPVHPIIGFLTLKPGFRTGWQAVNIGY